MSVFEQLLVIQKDIPFSTKNECIIKHIDKNATVQLTENCASEAKRAYENNFLIHHLKEQVEKNGWPTQTNIKCFGHHRSFTTVPIFLPTKYNEEANEWNGFGIFCSPECVNLFWEEYPEFKTANNYGLIFKMMKQIFNKPIEHYEKSMPFEVLKEYGGKEEWKEPQHVVRNLPQPFKIIIDPTTFEIINIEEKACATTCQGATNTTSIKNSVFGFCKKGQWPKTCPYKCFGCHEYFQTQPIPIPYFVHTDHFYYDTWGVCCSSSCAFMVIRSRAFLNTPQIQLLFKKMLHNEFHLHFPLSHLPPFFVLSEYGGPLGREKWRQLSYQPIKIIVWQKPFLMSEVAYDMYKKSEQRKHEKQKHRIAQKTIQVDLFDKEAMVDKNQWNMDVLGLDEDDDESDDERDYEQGGVSYFDTFIENKKLGKLPLKPEPKIIPLVPEKKKRGRKKKEIISNLNDLM